MIRWPHSSPKAASTPESSETPAPETPVAKAAAAPASAATPTSPTAGAGGSRPPTAAIRSVKVAPAAECRRTAAASTLAPSARGIRRTIEVLRALLVDVHRIPAHVPVEAVVMVLGVASVKCVVVVAVVIPVVVIAIAAVIATVVAAVPGRIPVEGVVVINHGIATPIASPGMPAPGATHRRPHRDPSPEGKKPCCDEGTGTVARSDIRGAVDDRRIVLRDVHNLRVGGLDDNGLRRRLRHRDLRGALEIAGRFSLCSQGLNGGHHVGLLV